MFRKKPVKKNSRASNSNKKQSLNHCSSWLFGLGLFLVFNFILRISLIAWQYQEVKTLTITTLLKVFVVGISFDIVAFFYIALLPLIYYYLVPNKFFNSSRHYLFNLGLYFTMIFVILFSFFSEVVFWEEFQTRFNFIAVDYLIYTTEVVNNIIESYPIYKLLLIIAIIAFAIFFFTFKKLNFVSKKSYKTKFKELIVILIAFIASFLCIDSSKLTKISDNNYLNEISANGIYQLFSAYRNNQIDFLALYHSIEHQEASNLLRETMEKQEPNSKFLNQNQDNADISRLIAKRIPLQSEQKYNIIFITMESLSADFMAHFGNKDNLTPNLDQLTKEGLFFSNLKATGTRTVRGLEALSLSVPPTPGNSIVRRKNNENLFNISSPLKNRGYEAKFIYGGDGYFDNMNGFFANNGFRAIDRKNFTKEEITFSNAWGVADEDLYNKVIKEADESFSKGSNFINFVMTTSNHRPFSYPDNKIDIPSKSNRDGAVKYADYAVGKLIENSKNKPWFDKTIFVFVADHCAGSAGNTDVPLWRYQIPAIFYAPKIIKPQIFDKNISQIDIAPTLLGFLNLEYPSKFFGTDVIANSNYLNLHSFVSTYTDIGYFKEDKLYLLKPKKVYKVFDVKFEKFGYQGSQEEIIARNRQSDKNQDNLEVVNPAFQQYSQNLQKELNYATSYYQIASYLFQNGQLKNFADLQK